MGVKNNELIVKSLQNVAPIIKDDSAEIAH
jgi:hypothetical protein